MSSLHQTLRLAAGDVAVRGAVGGGVSLIWRPKVLLCQRQQLSASTNTQVLQSSLATSYKSPAAKKGTHAFAIMVRAHDVSRRCAVRVTTTPLLRGSCDDLLAWLSLCVTCKWGRLWHCVPACHVHIRTHATCSSPAAGLQSGTSTD
jgi:hypothetical protein